MELAKIQELLAIYFEGNTSLAQENTLKEYFKSNQVDDSLLPYKSLFVSFSLAKEERSTKEIVLPTQKKSFWQSQFFKIAAMLVVVLGVAGFLYNQPTSTQITVEEQEALLAYNQTKEALFILSSNFNKGTEDLKYVTKFSEKAEEIKYVNQFSTTTNKYFK